MTLPAYNLGGDHILKKISRLSKNFSISLITGGSGVPTYAPHQYFPPHFIYPHPLALANQHLSQVFLPAMFGRTLSEYLLVLIFTFALNLPPSASTGSPDGTKPTAPVPAGTVYPPCLLHGKFFYGGLTVHPPCL